MDKRLALVIFLVVTVVLTGCIGANQGDGTQPTQDGTNETEMDDGDVEDGTQPTGDETEANDTDEMDGDNETMGTGPHPVLTVGDQETNGSAVTVTEAVIDEEGWLVVHPEAEGGGPNGSSVLAQKQLSEGSYQDVSLTFDDPVTTDQTVYAMLHYDDPMDDEFTFPENGDPAVIKEGNPLVKPVELTVTQQEQTQEEETAETPAVEVATDVTPDRTIDLTNTEFSNTNPSVSSGTVIRFVNQEGAHTVTLDAQEIDRTLSEGESVALRFNEDGTYQVYCRFHGSPGSGMHTDVSVGQTSDGSDTSNGGGGGYGY